MEEDRSNPDPEVGVPHARAFGWTIFFWAASIMGAISALCVLGAPSGVARATLAALTIICFLVAMVAKLRQHIFRNTPPYGVASVDTTCVQRRNAAQNAVRCHRTGTRPRPNPHRRISPRLCLSFAPV